MPQAKLKKMTDEGRDVISYLRDNNEHYMANTVARLIKSLASTRATLQVVSGEYRALKAETISRK